MEGAITIRKVAADCIKTVRSLTESEEEAAELVLAIWTAAMNAAAHGLKVGKSISLMPLGVLYTNQISHSEREAQLNTSELFIMQYGVSVRPGEQARSAGPSSKLPYGDVALAANIADKAVIPNVLTALLHRIGEMIAQHPKVRIDCSPIGELRCEEQRLEFIPATKQAANIKPPSSTAPKNTIRTILARKKKEKTGGFDDAMLSARSEPPAQVGNAASDWTGPASARGAQVQPHGLLKVMSRKRLDQGFGDEQQFMISPRQKVEDSHLTSMSTVPSSRSLDKPKASSVESQAIISGQFQRSLPAMSMLFPPLLEEFSRTLAAPYGEELYCGSTSVRVASHFSPQAAQLVWSPEAKALRWRAQPKDKAKDKEEESNIEEDESALVGPDGLKILEDSPLDLDLKDAAIPKRQFLEGLSRYRYYTTEGISDSVIAPINQSWVDNIGFLVEAEKFLPELTAERLDVMLSEVHGEMLAGYAAASKKAITDYILKDEKSRQRAGVYVVPALVTDWGSKPFEGIEGTFGGPPQEWRAGIEQNRDMFVASITVCCQSTLRLMDLWNGPHIGFGNELLVDLPPPAAPLQDIDEFFSAQKEHQKATVEKLQTQWFDEVCVTLRDETEHINTPTEGRFFESIATLLAIETRLCVEKSMSAFVQFFKRYANPDPKSPEEVSKLKDTDEREDAFLTVKLTTQREEIRFRHTPEAISERILRIFEDFITSLNSVPRPESKVHRGASNTLRKDKSLWGMSLDEQYVQNAEKVVEDVVAINLANMEKALRVYDDYVHLLTEEQRTREFMDDQTKTNEDYMKMIKRLRDTEKAVREKLPNEIRMQMISVDCVDLNDILCAKSRDCVKILLENIADRNQTRNDMLYKNFENVVNTIHKKPTSAAELVDLETTLEQFRHVDMKSLLEEYNDIKSWQQLLFECNHLLTPTDFKAIKESANWVQSIDGTVESRENELKAERNALENKFKSDRAKFEEDLDGYLQLVGKFKEAGNMRQMDEYLEKILALKEKFERAKFDAEKFNEKEVMLGWDATDFEKLAEGVEKLEPYDKLWSLAYEFTKSNHTWTRGPLFSLDPETVQTEANTMWRNAFKLQATFQQMDLGQPEGVAKTIKTQLDTFKANLPLVHALCNPGLRARHWEEISNIVGFAMEPDNNFTLSRVIDMEVGKHMEELGEISESAGKEYGLEKSLEQMLGEWQPVKFELKKWKDTGTFIVAGVTVEEMQGLMDDHIIKTQTMKGSPYAKPFAQRIEEWEGWLIMTQEIMDVWTKVQGVWLYLEPIFFSEDIMKQMPVEGALFKKVDEAWRLIMSVANEQAKALVVTKSEGLLDKLRECNTNLETVQKGLNDYLETKRLAFPRFFFLSNDNLLEILSETKDPTRVNPHMKKAFEGIQELEFQPDTKITALISSEKEKVPVKTVVDPVLARGSVEVWLIQVEATMLETIRDVTLQSSEDYKGRKFSDWLKMWPGQVVLSIHNLYWTLDVGTALKEEGNVGLAKYELKMKDILIDIVDMVRSEIPKLVRDTLEALIVIFVHNKDTVLELKNLGIEKEDDFDWQVQLRYFIEPNPDMENRPDMYVKITNSCLAYAYEYLGNSSRLIVTPLTDRCYRTCCGALHLLYGAAPEGPAGTGKTETTKDLAKALARLCVVFNCSDELDYLAMGKFFKGLASSGGWACFDEFNRIDPEVLSVIAQQILCIQLAVKARLLEFDFEGTWLPLKWTCNVFITMNPGYAGRSDLPDNLKALFRTVAMMVPDYALIAEIKLYAYGYEDSRSLAQKIVTTYKLCSEQLSSQSHYDYGMRAVFSVLVAAGNLKRKSPQEEESILMLRSINDVNLAKFLAFDVPLFRGITSDLFPGIELPKPDYSLLINKLTEHLELEHCQPHPYFIEKIIQFYECHTVRHSVMLVGMPYSGKTTGLNTLQKALTDLANAGTMHAGCIVHQARLNPKSIPPRDLYGCFDEVSHEWTDGIVAVTFREFARNQTEERKWLVFDGPVDAVWIENMNTVMDDNKKLCLNSGEIIAMSPNMRTIIEPMDVEVASPATISRNGMVYFEPHLMGYQHLLDKCYGGSLPEEFDEKDTEELKGMIDWVLRNLIIFARENLKEVAPTQDQNLVQSALELITTHLHKMMKHEKYQHDVGIENKDIISGIDSYVVFCSIWAVGAVCDTSSRPTFSAYIRKLLTGQAPPIKAFKKLNPVFPERGGVFDYCFDLASTQWMPWMDTCEPQTIPATAKVEQITVQTMDNVRYRYILQHCIENRIKLLFCGPTGTGKTTYMQQSLLDLPKEGFAQIFVGFSAKTKCNQTQDLIDSKLDRRRKGVFGPPMGKLCCVMVDDLNMPAKETYGAQPPVEILRQMIDKYAYPPSGGWFDREDSTHPFKNIVDVLLFAAMGPPGGGRTFITPRINGHLYLVGFPLLDDDNMSNIFQTILDWKLNKDGYPSEIVSLSKKLVQGTMEVYKLAAEQLLPTPLKVHYTFNLRDFAKIIFGILLVTKESCDGADRHLRLWVHEVQRVLGDRLTDDTDRLWMLTTLRETVKKSFGASFDDTLRHLDSNGDNKVDTLDEIRLLFFSDMLSPPAAPKRPYVECNEFDKLQKEVESHLEQHNMMSSKPMDLVCFLYMLEHLSRVARIVRTPGGNALLVGVGGSGRQSCTRLAAFMADYQVFQIEIAKGYDVVAFREDIKKLLTLAGGKGENTIFLFSDSQIKDEGFVEDINNLLNTGEVPNLFPPEERVQICEMVRPDARNENRCPEGTPSQLYSYFVERCRAKLGISLCFSPIGDAWRSRLRQFPSLVNCCTIDWFTEWPPDALQAVAQKFLGQIPNLEQSLAACVEMCSIFHSESTILGKRFKDELKRIYYATPTSFLELIQTFKSLLGGKRKEVMDLKNKYTVGLEKLVTTEESVEGMKKELIELQPKLVEKNKEVGEMMVVVNEETAKTEKVKEVVSADEAAATESANKSNAIKMECEGELAEAMPALNAALKALDTLTGKDIAEIKAMKSPPAPVRLVLSGVCIMKGLKPARVKDESGKMVEDYWPIATKMVSEMGFLQSLSTYDKDNIQPAIIKKIASYTPQEDFQPDRVEKVSKAAFGLCMWVRAMETYDRVAKVVAPKKVALAEAEEEYAGVMVKLNEKRAELQKVVDQLQKLNDKLAGLKQEQDDLAFQVDLCQKKLSRAESLINGLGGEKTRWSQNAVDLSELFVSLTGDVIVASGIIAYLGAFTPDFRDCAVKDWATKCREKAIPGSEKFGLENCLGEPVKVRNWVIAGLPNDSFSIENGIIVDKARRWPLCIDPQGQANKWIKKLESTKNVLVAKFTDGDYLKRLEGCITFGYPVLIENVEEETDPAIEPVLLRQTFKKGTTVMMKLGDSIVEYSPDFKFYLTTKLRNPHYLPEVAVKVTLLNFMITLVGLQDQLLNIVVAKERPELAEEKARLVVEGAENKAALEKTENEILDVLSNSKGNILEDESAIQILSASKVLADDIAEKQKVADETEKQIDEARQGYVPIAFKTGILFFCIADLANIDPMYQYSLPFFINLFINSIERSPQSSVLEERIVILNDFFMEALYNNICRSLFEKHKLLFSFLLCTRLLMSEEKIEMADYRFLLTGGVSLEDPPEKPAEWLPDGAWSEIFRLSKMTDPKYEKFHERFAKEEHTWKKIYDDADPMAMMKGERRPDHLRHLGPFEDLLVLRTVRPDRVVPAILHYVSDVLGEKFVTPPPFDLAGSYTESSNISPLIFILSPGADAFSALNKYAGEKGVEVNCISLGQGQGPKAEKLMEQAMKDGTWVMLQNCHLATSWMPKLDRMLDKFDPKQIHADFRLWLTSYPSNKFPVAILQNSVKMTNEPPKGLRANVGGSFLMDPISNSDFFEGCKRPKEFKCFCYTLCFFHAVIQERRLFGPLGWNIPYEFTEHDLRISVRQLQMFLDEAGPNEVPIKAINYLTGECNYGGRVTDDKDRRLLMTLLAKYYSTDMLEEGKSMNDEHPEYVVPTVGKHQSYIDAIKSLPLVTPPGIFGFHENANLTKEQGETYQMMESLLLTVGSASSGGGKGPEDVVREVADSVLQRMPDVYNLVKIQEQYPTRYDESMNTVLIQEATRFNRLIAVVLSSLKDMQKALKGLLLLSADLEMAFFSIFDGKTPAMWLGKSYPSLKPLGSYVNDLVERLKFFQRWIDEGIPITFWLSGIYFTQAFTTGASQNYARKYTIPIDILTFDFFMYKDQDPKERPADGVYTYGVYLEGCKWDNREWQLNESDPKVLFTSVPMITIVPCKKDGIVDFPHYNCPMYKISSRKGTLSTTGHSTNFVMYIRVASDKPQSHWVMRGVAMLTQLDT